MQDPEPATVVEYLSHLASERADPINAYWLSLSGDRDTYAGMLRSLLDAEDTAVIVVRTGGFDNPNSLMQDLARLLNTNRVTLEEFFGSRPRPPERFGIVLLARSDLRIPQSSSPVPWPEWVPGVGGLETACYIQDISRSVEVALDSSELGLERLNRGLYELECALLRRLRSVHEKDQSTHEPLYDLLRRQNDPGGWLGLIANVQRTLDSETSTEAYRPTGRGSRSLCGRLWVEVRACDPASLPAFASALAVALQLSDAGTDVLPRESLFTVFARVNASSNFNSPEDRSARDLLNTISMACQVITCAAHAGEYDRYPLPLLQSVVDELHRNVASYESMINRLPAAALTDP